MVVSRPALCFVSFLTLVMLQKAALCYCTVRTCRDSSNAACRSICDAFDFAQIGSVLLYCPHVSWINRCYASINLGHVCYLAMRNCATVLPARIANGPILRVDRLVGATKRYHAGALERTCSQSYGWTHASMHIHKYALWKLWDSEKWLCNAPRAPRSSRASCASRTPRVSRASCAPRAPRAPWAPCTSRAPCAFCVSCASCASRASWPLWLLLRARFLSSVWQFFFVVCMFVKCQNISNILFGHCSSAYMCCAKL